MTTRRASRRWWLILGVMFLGLRAWGQAPYLTITVGTIELLPNQAGQVVELWIENSDRQDFQAKGMNLRMQIDDGKGGGNAPVFEAVEAVLGTPWESVSPGVKPAVTDPEYRDVRLLTDPFDDHQVGVLPAGSLTRLATVTLDTTGLNGGTWSFRLAGMSQANGDLYPGSTDYAAVGGLQVHSTVINGQLTVVPEPETWALIGSLSLLAWAIARRKR
ncbi:MAG: PEP-CTERM sorting domain-containing protein [Verrucomicrobiales bacterium]|nr:PEP-CTERM sorting domain-containing protein [Verrucomicrobiales bacterium]